MPEPKANTIEIPNYIGVEEAAKILCIGPATLRRRIVDGTITAYQVKGVRQYLLKPADVEKAIQKVVPAIQTQKT